MVILSSIFGWLVSVADSIIVMILSIVGLIIILVVVGIFSLFGDDDWSSPTYTKNDAQYEAEFIDRLSNIYGLTVPERAETLYFSSYYDAGWDGWEDFHYNLILNSKGIASEVFIPEGARWKTVKSAYTHTYDLCDTKETLIEDTELRKIMCSLKTSSIKLNRAIKVLDNVTKKRVLELKDNIYEIEGQLYITFIPDSDFVWIQEDYGREPR